MDELQTKIISCNHGKDLIKIKIMFIIDFFYGVKEGGTENQFIKLINHLDRNKYEIYLITLRKTEWLSDYGKTLDCKIKSYDILRIKDPRTILTFFLIIGYIRSSDPDIVMTFFPLSNIIGVFAAKLGGVKNILSTRRDYGLWLNWLFKRDIYLLKFANRFVTGIIANAECVKEVTSNIEKFDKSKIKVIYNGLDVKKNGPKTTDGEKLKQVLRIPLHNKVVGIVAHLVPMKRHSTFLKAAKHVLGQRNDINFLIIGDGPLRTELELLAYELRIKEHVHFVGAQEDVLPYLSCFDVGVNCSANEGLSNAIMEYMAYGVPCIVSDAGGNPELIEHGINGYLFELDNDIELADKIIHLLDDEKKQKEFISKSKEKIMEKLTLDKMVSAYDEYFTEILRITA